MSGTDSAHTRQVKQLIALIGDHRSKPQTLLNDAKAYFEASKDNEASLAAVQSDIANAEDNDINAFESKLKSLKRDIDNERLERLSRVNDVISNLMKLSEGQSEEETLEQSAKSLGTIFLISDAASNQLANVHQTLKPAYKAILSLRLCDAILKSGSLKHGYLSQYTESHSRFSGNRHWQEKWLTGIARPLIKAAMFQDIGLQHPQAQKILYGIDNNKDPFRVLDEQERKQLLKLNYHYTLDYIKNGLGLPGYVGNSKAERDKFYAEEQDALDFCTEVIAEAFTAKHNVGELIKIPQIYASFVLSTKQGYNRAELPKGYMVIEQLAKNGKLNPKMAEYFLALVGYFPQGFGISYIPFDDTGTARDIYEYAIVNRLCPASPAEPQCRAVTRHLSFIRSGKDLIVKKHQNLYFQSNHKKLIHTSEARLKEIRAQLSSQLSIEEDETTIPRFWEPSDYFADKKHQNLWNKLS
ncbi:hypothetical protein DRW07_17420 [Alteromonas sediminis]|uniref:Uncharacterized protein n=1 Tax=Alteromonas sediminis TaxID=2259342 RepID=A0A3N5XXD7_9ALTE|nr:hypothetical protein [Alteromonas sediminis]RPJ65093.1 hypothetical protein DRW07_17420 [Alteromonas sediminis]